MQLRSKLVHELSSMQYMRMYTNEYVWGDKNVSPRTVVTLAAYTFARQNNSNYTY